MALGVQRAEEGRYWNSLAVIEPDGTVSQTYDKHHLVPFGEYMPLGDLAYEWFGLSAFAAQHGAGYTAGTGPKLLDFGPVMGRALPLICYEAVFPQDVNAAPERPDWLMQITNDAWFGTLTGPFQHAAQARLRAVEMGLPLVRVANTGVTGVTAASAALLSEGERYMNGLGNAFVVVEAREQPFDPSPDEVRAIGMQKWGAEFVSPHHDHKQAFHFAEAWDKSMPYAYQVKRAEFDTVLIRNAARKGVMVHEGCKVRAVDFLPDDRIAAEIWGRVLSPLNGSFPPSFGHKRG